MPAPPRWFFAAFLLNAPSALSAPGLRGGGESLAARASSARASARSTTDFRAASRQSGSKSRFFTISRKTSNVMVMFSSSVTTFMNSWKWASARSLCSSAWAAGTTTAQKSSTKMPLLPSSFQKLDERLWCLSAGGAGERLPADLAGDAAAGRSWTGQRGLATLAWRVHRGSEASCSAGTIVISGFTAALGLDELSVMRAALRCRTALSTENLSEDLLPRSPSSASAWGTSRTRMRPLSS
mmetsp:Transcript_22613/g.59737  ORF Transcript_22613/g.59737 Transcript_22613/m.59737 type:complete len:240 (+) Transcript_22613:1323-2042(+)